MSNEMTNDQELARLSTDALARSWPAVVPRYDRTGPAPIVHVGMGGFARAHLGSYADDLLRQGWPAMIRAVSLRSSRAAEQLNPQDCLYTVSEREVDGDPTPKVMGSIASCRTGPRSLVEAILDPTTALVTLTITEKGYDLLPGERLRAPTGAAMSAPAVIAYALGERRRAGSAAPIVAAMDNLLDNGDTLRDRVASAAATADQNLADWIAGNVAFPNSVVDRMVPATTPADLDEVAWRLDLIDQAAVVAERHRSWVITDCDGLPPLTDVGIEVVSDIVAYQRRKLLLLNAPHSALAYCGLLAGCDTIAAAAGSEVVGGFVEHLTGAILEVADLPAAIDAAAFAAESMQRFRNPALGHTCVQVATDGSQKLPQRLLPAVVARIERGLPVDRFAVVAAAWLAAASGIPLRGYKVPDVPDPRSAALRTAAQHGDLAALAATGLGDGVPHRFITDVAAALSRLRQDGPMALLARP